MLDRVADLSSAHPAVARQVRGALTAADAAARSGLPTPDAPAVICTDTAAVRRSPVLSRPGRRLQVPSPRSNRSGFRYAPRNRCEPYRPRTAESRKPGVDDPAPETGLLSVGWVGVTQGRGPFHAPAALHAPFAQHGLPVKPQGSDIAMAAGPMSQASAVAALHNSRTAGPLTPPQTHLLCCWRLVHAHDGGPSEQAGAVPRPPGTELSLTFLAFRHRALRAGAEAGRGGTTGRLGKPVAPSAVTGSDDRHRRLGQRRHDGAEASEVPAVAAARQARAAPARRARRYGGWQRRVRRRVRRRPSTQGWPGGDGRGRHNRCRRDRGRRRCDRWRRLGHNGHGRNGCLSSHLLSTHQACLRRSFRR